MSASDGVSVSIDVDVEPELVFAVFTEELDAWWGRGPRFRFLAPYDGTVTLEPGVGGRLLHVQDAAAGRVFVVGRIEVWEPPHRFEPLAEGTRVTVTHRGWDSVPARHAARHGLTGHDFIPMRGQWWGDILTAVRRHVQSRRVRAQAGGDQR